ncbi:hypothetical protein [Spirillospora sp. CA-294931]|uniref:hypothetical protein n=1 Tax=Spirillospora sp. CA-294931 TaxID=3240042 RepID=UPI003D8BDB48
MAGRTRHLWAALTGLGLGLVALGPGLAPGFVLSYDMVFVPDPGFTAMTFGLDGVVPRHVPSDAVVTALSTVLPAVLVQKALLLAIFVLACTSAASLVPSSRLLPRLVAGVCYTWNPFVAERLLLGQWALLLGYAALPWVVAAAAQSGEPGGGRRLVRALIPAAIGGFAALAVSGLTALVVAAFQGRTALGRTFLSLTVLSLPWLVPGLLRPSGVPGDGSAVEAFAARADTPFGSLGSLLLLGGTWNSETVPDGYGNPVTATLWLLLVLTALITFARTGGREGWALGGAGAVGFVVAALGVVVPSLLRGVIEGWSGFAVLRDGQQFVAPLAVVIAMGLGMAAERVMRARFASVAVGLAVAPVLLLPTLAWGGAGALRAVDYPGDWDEARRIVEREPGDVLVLPWAAHRSYPWNHGRRLLDPLPRYLNRRVIVNDAVTVGDTTVAAEDPRVRRLDPVIKGGGPLTRALQDAGVRYVAVDEPGAAVESRLAGAAKVLSGPDLVLYRVPGNRAVREAGVPVWPVVIAWIVVCAVVVWSSKLLGSTLGSPHTRRRTP